MTVCTVVSSDNQVREYIVFSDILIAQACLLETLKQTGYCGPYLIEMWSETSADPLAEVAKARDWVKARMARAGLMEAA